jgi:hypothetical protein
MYSISVKTEAAMAASKGSRKVAGSKVLFVIGDCSLVVKMQNNASS